jgi:two-component system chemotaxis response regulator CheY
MSLKINILLVDDVEYSRQLLRTTLLTCINAHKVVIKPSFFHSSNGQLIIEQIESEKINLVYLDIDLTNISGIDILKDVREVYPNIVVVMVSGENSSKNVTDAIKSGANGFIVKPFNSGRVNDSLDNYLKKEGKV